MFLFLIPLNRALLRRIVSSEGELFTVGKKLHFLGVLIFANGPFRAQRKQYRIDVALNWLVYGRILESIITWLNNWTVLTASSLDGTSHPENITSNTKTRDKTLGLSQEFDPHWLSRNGSASL